jgi:hypothetical protein
MPLILGQPLVQRPLLLGTGDAPIEARDPVGRDLVNTGFFELSWHLAAS